MTDHEDTTNEVVQRSAAQEVGGLTTGQAAQELTRRLDRNFSVTTVRRMVKRGQLRAWWTKADDPRTDLRGNTLRGHRRVDPASVALFAESERKRG